MDTKRESISDQLFGKWFSKDANEIERKEAEEWANKSDANRKLLTDTEKLLADMEQLSVMESIDSANALNKVKNRIRFTKSNRSKFLFYCQKIAAIIVLPLFIYALVEIGSKFYSTNTEQISWNEISTPVGLRSAFQLPDGTKVWLNGNTHLKYPLKFTNNERRIELEGEAYFEVVSDAQNPFIVNAGGLLVQAVGTSFNVSAFSNKSEVYTALIEGKVNLLEETEDGRQNILTLHPGELATYNKKTKNYQIISEDLDKHIAYRNGKILFRNDPLEEVLNKLGNWYSVDFQISDIVKNKKYAYTGSFQEEGLHQVLEYIELTTPVKFVFSEPKQNSDNTYNKRSVQVIKR